MTEDTITREEVLVAQKKWGQAIVEIGEAYTRGEDYKALAVETFDKLYAYGHSPVLFKPTKATRKQFRHTLDEAVSYFVGGVVPEDQGFAIHPWSKVEFEQQGMVFHPGNAITMGNYVFTDSHTGEEVKAEFTFGYVKTPQGKVRIFLHHSSLPFQD